MELESKLIPIMREGIEVVKMIFFMEVRGVLARTYPEKDSSYISKMTGAVVNELFGTPNNQEPFGSFAKENRKNITNMLASLPKDIEKMRIPVTDALRMQFLCDAMEDVDSKAVLEHAEKIGFLITGRDLPLPHHFMDLVRRLGKSYNLLIPPLPKEGPRDEIK